MRTCCRCGNETVTTKVGTPVCDGCKMRPTGRRCLRCDDTLTGGRERICDGCRADPRPRRTIKCATCGAEYRTRGGNRSCGRCRRVRNRHPCERCGAPCDRRAKWCQACRTAIPTRGPDNANWKGGRTRHKQHGYVRIKRPDHPAAASDGYVREHTLVMEAKIGRLLLPGENAHHLNGVRDDNRPENLELWAKTQPAGQRAVDLLAWAREIVDRYEPIEDVLSAG